MRWDKSELLTEDIMSRSIGRDLTPRIRKIAQNRVYLCCDSQEINVILARSHYLEADGYVFVIVWSGVFQLLLIIIVMLDSIVTYKGRIRLHPQGRISLLDPSCLMTGLSQQAARRLGNLGD